MKQLFIIGSYRTGTTLLRLMLSQHIAIHIPPETAILPEMLVKYQDVILEKDSYNTIKAYTAFKKSCLSQGWSEFPLLSEVQGDLENGFTIAQLYLAILKVHAKQCGKSDVIWLGDNTPVYIMSLGVLEKEFPEAKYIHMVRDVRDVIASVMDAPFKSCFNIESCVYEWSERVLHGIAAEKWLGKDRMITIRYEDLAATPSDTLTSICNFLGVKYDPIMLYFYESRIAEVIAKQSHHHNAIKKATTNSIGRYKNRLNKKAINKITNLAYSPLRAYGYEVSTPHRIPQRNSYKYRKFAENYLKLLTFRAWKCLLNSILR